MALTDDPRVAIVDIGSNSVRLVIFAGADRPRDKLFTEKVAAGLGRRGERGRLPAAGRALALNGLKRFRAIADDMGITTVHGFATAAVREASDGLEFIREVEEIGIGCTLVDGRAEAQLAGLGVLTGMLEAKGMVADLGGGSFDLAWVAEGKTGPGVSLPLGVLRTTAADEATARRQIRRGLDDSELERKARGAALHLVGGSFRTLARIDRALDGRKSEKAKGYRMTAERPAAIREALEAEPERISRLVEDPRLATSPTAAMLLDELVGAARPSELIVSGYGVREGFLGLLGDPLAFARVLG